MKILVDAETERILGIGGDEIMHSFPNVMYANAPYSMIQRAMHIRPTVTELNPMMLGDLKSLELTALRQRNQDLFDNRFNLIGERAERSNT